MKNRYGELAEAILEIGALKLNVETPFLWASGYYMPVYNDNRLFLKEKRYRSMIAEAFVSIMQENGIKADVVAGTSTAGIPHAAVLADRLDLPLTYVRDRPKDHGLGNRIEGLPGDRGFEGRRVVLIEDLISTGGSSIDAVKSVRAAGGQIQYCLSIFTYGLDKASAGFSSLDPVCRTFSILSYGELVQAAENRGYIGREDAEVLREWRMSPFEWGSRQGFPPVLRGMES